MPLAKLEQKNWDFENMDYFGPNISIKFALGGKISIRNDRGT